LPYLLFITSNQVLYKTISNLSDAQHIHISANQTKSFAHKQWNRLQKIILLKYTQKVQICKKDLTGLFFACEETGLVTWCCIE